MARKSWSDEEKAALLEMFAASDLSEAAFCRVKGISRSTFQGWRDSPEGVRQLRQRQKRRLTEMYQDEIEASLEAAGSKRDQASYRDLMVGVGILDDKLTRAKGEPTQRLAVEDLRQAATEAGLDPDDVIAEVEAMLRERE